MNEYNKKNIFIINKYIIIFVIFKNNINLNIIILNYIKFVINNISIIIISSKNYIDPINKLIIYSFDDETIGFKRNRTFIFYLNNKTINIINSYINFFLSDNINKAIFQSYPKPKISVIIPLYNA